jgi:hypothetical protein
VSPEELAKSTSEARAITDRLYQTIKEAPDRLSLSALNSALLILLKNQTTIMESLSTLSKKIEENKNTPRQKMDIKVRSKSIEDQDVEDQDAEDQDAEDQDAEDQILKDRKQENQDEQLIEEDEEVGTEDDLEILLDEDKAKDQKQEPEQSEAEPAPINEVPKFQTRIAIRSFDKRDNDFDKGLTLLNSWVSGETGTPFQIRKEPGYAYLNVSGLTMEQIDQRVSQVNRIFGIHTKLGQMSWDGLTGDIWLYAR